MAVFPNSPLDFIIQKNVISKICFGSKYLQKTKERLLNVEVLTASGESETRSMNWNREFKTFINPLRPKKNSTYYPK